MVMALTAWYGSSFLFSPDPSEHRRPPNHPLPSCGSTSHRPPPLHLSAAHAAAVSHLTPPPRHAPWSTRRLLAPRIHSPQAALPVPFDVPLLVSALLLKSPGNPATPTLDSIRHLPSPSFVAKVCSPIRISSHKVFVLMPESEMLCEKSGIKEKVSVFSTTHRGTVVLWCSSYLNCCGGAAVSGCGGVHAVVDKCLCRIYMLFDMETSTTRLRWLIFCQATVHGMKINTKIVGSKVLSPAKELTMNIDASFFANGLGGAGAVIRNDRGERLCNWCLLATPKSSGCHDCRGNCIAEILENGGGHWAVFR